MGATQGESTREADNSTNGVCTIGERRREAEADYDDQMAVRGIDSMIFSSAAGSTGFATQVMIEPASRTRLAIIVLTVAGNRHKDD